MRRETEIRIEPTPWQMALLAGAFGLVALVGGAQETPNQATTTVASSEAGAGDTTQTESLGAWWKKSATSFDPLPSGWLFHFEGTLSFQRLEGNSNGKYYTGALGLTIRKGKFTLYNDYSYAEQDIEYGGEGGWVDNKKAEASLTVRRDLLHWLFIEAGESYEIDDTFYIDRRTTGFVGVGVFFVPHPSHTLESILAGGRQKTAYVGVGGDSAVKDTDTGWSLGCRWEWTAATWLILEATGQLWEFDEDVSDERQHGGRLDYGIEASIPLNTHVAFSLKHNVKYENNWLIRILEEEKKDITQTIGVKFSF